MGPASLALISVTDALRAADRCADTAQAVEGLAATIKTLIDHGATVGLNDRSKTAADIARGLGHERASKLLERRTA
jgi:hypothetical protein